MLRVCFAASEFAPLAKTGGLADVAAGLTRFLVDLEQDVRVFLPFYSTIDASGLDVRPLDFARDVPIDLGGRTERFTLCSADAPGIGRALYLVDCPALFHRAGIYPGDGDDHRRFALFTRAVIEGCQRMGWGPDVFHVNDWHTALLPLYLRSTYAWDRLFESSKTVLTIHNLGYQGIFASEVVGDLGIGGYEHLLHQDDLHAGRVGFLKTGLLYADVITTVSRTYAREIQTPEAGCGLDDVLRARSDHLVGIVNGIDEDVWNPATDAFLAQRYDRDDLEGKKANTAVLQRDLGLPVRDDVPVVGLVSRLTWQKGFDLMFEPLPRLLLERDMQFVALGSGESKYEDFLAWLQRTFPQKVCFYRGYHDELAHRIEAGAHVFLMPSRFEPCGLNQMYSLKYGTVPVVRNVGGLADTVEPWNPETGQGTGFVFEHDTAEGFRWALASALTTFRDMNAWTALVRNGMARDFSWRRQGREYLSLYAGLCGK